MNIPEKALAKYLAAKEKAPIRILRYHKIGSGWHGTGSSLVYLAGKTKKEVILRTERPVGFSHEYPADQARVFLLQHQMSKMIPRHVESIDVGGLMTNDKVISIGDCTNFFQLVEKAKGIEYMSDLEAILKRGKLSASDKQKALRLSDYLVQLHSRKFTGAHELGRSIHRRHTRDAVGHGEMLMGVIDTYPDELSWISRQAITELILAAVRFRERIKDKHYRLCRMHGDFHPSNIIFKNRREFMVLDASREVWGEPADDLTALGINYLWFALRQKGKFTGPFMQLFRLFLNNYLKKTRDTGVYRILPLFMAFRGVVVAHPRFYPDQTDSSRRKMFRFIASCLKAGKFKWPG
jgi:aminoglycoside phosphotransferase (APT) family kinase protein